MKTDGRGGENKNSGRKLNRREFFGAAAMAAGVELLRPRFLWAGQNTSTVPLKGASHTFGWRGDQFLLDGKPIQIHSGEMHYARVPRAYWRDRLQKLKSMGLNTVSTYVFWNFQEPQPGKYDFTGRRDVAAFVRTAQQEGLWVTLRLGPYVCAEWDFGGFPAWLLATPDIRVRSTDPRFLDPARRYMREIGQHLAPLQITQGGPVIMAQVENEYGSFGDNKAYMNAIKDMIVDAGFDVTLFTADGPTHRMLLGGSLPNVLSYIDFGSNPAKQFTHFAKFRQNVPQMAGEFYTGWFDHWGNIHHTGNDQNMMEGVQWMLSHGVSFNLYMFHGGTSFGFMNGANYGEAYEPDVTSYDYDAPLDEAGRPRTKYFALRTMIKQHSPAGTHIPELPAPLPLVEIPRFELMESADFYDLLGEPIRSEVPKPMESVGQSYGFILYRWYVERPTTGDLKITKMSDYAFLYQGANKLAELDRRFKEDTVSSIELAPAQPLDILIENMGRINYGPHMLDDRKGITEMVTLNGKQLKKWEIYPLPLTNLSQLQFSSKPRQGPRFYRGTFPIKAAGDTFIDMRGWGKGHVWVNGHHLGRFWRIGPEQALFLPGSWMKSGENEIIVLELEEGGTQSVQGVTHHIYETMETD